LTKRKLTFIVIAVMKLVIVESPNKCDTIKRYLGDDYNVMASYGHIRDLATSGKGGLGVDVDNNFTPTYKVDDRKWSVVNALKQAVKNSDEVILATDPDREGEAIAWHLAEVLKLNVKTNKRLEFHEITRDSITNAINTPRTIDLNLVSSQETRRILDRIIGFKLSTLLFKKIKSRSAGRVQSATLKILCDREEEIKAFISEEYWNIKIKIIINDNEYELILKKINGKEPSIGNKEECDKIINSLGENLTVTSVKKKIKLVEPGLPFTTSTLQQAAFNKLGFRTGKTQSIAQSLYEGISIGNDHLGLITYMRTDSTRLSPTFIGRSLAYIEDVYGETYKGKVRVFKGNENTQDAHEAIRPTKNHTTPEFVKPYLNHDQYSLYKLIYERAISSLMAPKKEEDTIVTLESNGMSFELEGARTLFDGFEALYSDKKKDKYLPEIHEGDIFNILNKEGEQKFTQPPTRYSEAQLVKKMEEVGIGRPSTYASTISLLSKRKYVTEEKGVLVVSEQGLKTNHVLGKYFPDVIDVKYTASMEKQLDEIEDGNESRNKILSDFYFPFAEEVEDAEDKMYEEEIIYTGETCPKCGAPLVKKEGPYGSFIGCQNFPKCSYIKEEPKEPLTYTGENCPNCGSPLVERKDKKGRVFVACSNFPKCKYIKKEENPAQEGFTEKDYIKKCPDCDGYLVKKKGKYGYFMGCTNYPKCKHMEKFTKRRG